MLSVQNEILDLDISVALKTNKKHNKKKRDGKSQTTACVFLFCFVFLLFCFDVIWGKCLSDVRVVFVNIWYKCTKKNNKNEKFYGCEKLYFTELLCEQKRKARDRKENFNIAPPQSCFVTVSVFIGLSVDVPFRQGIQNRLRVCTTPFDPALSSLPLRLVRVTFHLTRLFLHSKTTSNAGVEEEEEENSEELVPEHRAAPHSCRSPSMFVSVVMEKRRI